MKQTYYNSNLWKTDAPPETVYEIIKSYKQFQNEGEKVELQGTRNIDFSVNQDLKNSINPKGKYFTAVEPNWGPKSRATGSHNN